MTSLPISGVGQAGVVLRSVLLVRGLPYAVGLAWSLLYSTLTNWVRFPAGRGSGLPSPTLWLLGFLVPQLLTLLFYLWFIRLARSHLRQGGAGTEPLDPQQLFSRELHRVASIIRRARRWP